MKDLRRFFRFSNRKSGVYIWECYTDSPIVYLQDHFGKSAIAGIEKDAFSADTAILCSEQLFKKLQMSNKIATAKVYLLDEAEFSDGEKEYISEFINKKYLDIFDAFVSTHSYEAIHKLLIFKNSTRKSLEKLVEKYDDTEVRMLLLERINDKK